MTAAFAQVAPPVPSFDTNRARALGCLAQAIGYEAGNEPVAGQEAVAQVILNRLRHPAFPKTVCGVVYQGSERRMGCQFTFTCDGSLTRPRSASGIAQSMAIAERVLSGLGTTLVGGATHYHADYVSPYWAPSLVKITRIGAHIFYRMPGAPDTPAAVDANALRGEPLVGASVVFAQAPRTGAPPSAAPALSTFSPWGLPTLIIAPSGRLSAAVTGDAGRE